MMSQKLNYEMMSRKTKITDVYLLKMNLSVQIGGEM